MELTIVFNDDNKLFNTYAEGEIDKALTDISLFLTYNEAKKLDGMELTDTNGDPLGTVKFE